ncbi:FGGY-family carbohydrate kinase [Glaesserella parasuis]|uniref:FGGY-family carbohydrate kinase n=1 Tax=Glaesserella parasuis TaxID=738 RepID=UPI0013254F88|nr:FGGY-family carbohydrate kinase [Glaesserella parasuis]MCT8784484.1 carbohydrate kinase [Glaesserella parasuis]MDG6480306.1 carbohydrate kinase [Glaesserella parasuis]MDO9926462.1 FGGY-family carbohydrate kinase [Glaesserella parasuis]MDO9931033.1 FGGY-family carbohydrate kinase [Glaesserella parasuis]MDP0128573.1 FGGY-family carbohydrate kinase [Glaesserella parasuis]
MNYYLGIDCGGTFIKAALFDRHGQICGLARENVAVISEKAGYAERDMAQLWQVCANVIHQTLEKSDVEPTAIKGVGISAQGKGAFLLDKNKQPLGRAILSSDQRSIDIVKQWQKEGIPEKLYPITRQTLWTGHPVSILRWIKEHEPERYAQIGSVLMSHDYLRFCLTGELHCEETNISESNLYNMAEGKYDLQLAEILGLQEIIDKLPLVIAPNQVAGYVTEKASALCGLAVGTPVVGGLFDVVSTALCAGLDDETKLNAVLGTWSVVSGITDHIDPNQDLPFVYGRYAQAGKFIVHEASPTSAGNLEWFIKQWNLDYAHINQTIAELAPAASSVLFVPFLYGSNAGLGMQAGFYGIQAYHTQAHLLQAIYEGVLFSLMHHLNRMLQRFPNTQIFRVTGGPTKSPIWLQMLADLTGMTLEVPNIEETGCLGAAMMAMEAADENPPELLQQAMRQVQPNPEHFEAYQQKYQRYQQLVTTLKALH